MRLQLLLLLFIKASFITANVQQPESIIKHQNGKIELDPKFLQSLMKGLSSQNINPAEEQIAAGEEQTKTIHQQPPIPQHRPQYPKKWQEERPEQRAQSQHIQNQHVYKRMAEERERGNQYRGPPRQQVGAQNYPQMYQSQYEQGQKQTEDGRDRSFQQNDNQQQQMYQTSRQYQQSQQQEEKLQQTQPQQIQPQYLPNQQQGEYPQAPQFQMPNYQMFQGDRRRENVPEDNLDRQSNVRQYPQAAVYPHQNGPPHPPPSYLPSLQQPPAREDPRHSYQYAGSQDQQNQPEEESQKTSMHTGPIRVVRLSQ